MSKAIERTNDNPETTLATSVIGKTLFRNNNDSHSHMERVFLLTPRVLDL